jgi:Phosphotransferase system, mannose/fructose-specific component IIA
MISLIIVTHGSLSKGLLNASTIISGEPTNVFTYSLNPGNSIAEFEKVVKTAIAEKIKKMGRF